MDGQTLFEIADLNRLWVLFDAYESDLPWVKVGDSITFDVQSLPGQDLQKCGYLYRSGSKQSNQNRISTHRTGQRRQPTESRKCL